MNKEEFIKKYNENNIKEYIRLRKLGIKTLLPYNTPDFPNSMLKKKAEEKENEHNK